MKLPSLKLTAKALENRPSQHERSLPTIDFHVRAVGFRECIVKAVLAVFWERFERINLQKFSVRVKEALPKSWKLRMIWLPTRHLSYSGSQRVGICSVKERYLNTLTAWYLDVCFGCRFVWKLHEAKDGGICSFIYIYGIQFPQVTLVAIQMKKHVLYYRRIRPLFFGGGNELKKNMSLTQNSPFCKWFWVVGFGVPFSHLTGYLEQLGVDFKATWLPWSYWRGFHWRSYDTIC